MNIPAQYRDGLNLGRLDSFLYANFAVKIDSKHPAWLDIAFLKNQNSIYDSKPSNSHTLWLKSRKYRIEIYKYYKKTNKNASNLINDRFKEKILLIYVHNIYIFLNIS